MSIQLTENFIIGIFTDKNYNDHPLPSPTVQVLSTVKEENTTLYVHTFFKLIISEIKILFDTN